MQKLIIKIIYLYFMNRRLSFFSNNKAITNQLFYRRRSTRNYISPKFELWTNIKPIKHVNY